MLEQDEARAGDQCSASRRDLRRWGEDVGGAADSTSVGRSIFASSGVKSTPSNGMIAIASGVGVALREHLARSSSTWLGERRHVRTRCARSERAELGTPHEVGQVEPSRRPEPTAPRDDTSGERRAREASTSSTMPRTRACTARRGGRSASSWTAIAAHRVADEDDVAEVEPLEDGPQVGPEVLDRVAARRRRAIGRDHGGRTRRRAARAPGARRTASPRPASRYVTPCESTTVGPVPAADHVEAPAVVTLEAVRLVEAQRPEPAGVGIRAVPEAPHERALARRTPRPRQPDRDTRGDPDRLQTRLPCSCRVPPRDTRADARSRSRTRSSRGDRPTPPAVISSSPWRTEQHDLVADLDRGRRRRRP